MDTHLGYGLTTGLKELRDISIANRTVACDKVDEVNRVINIYEAYSYDGGKPVTYQDIQIYYNDWGQIQTWSSYNPDVSAYTPACASTEP